MPKVSAQAAHSAHVARVIVRCAYVLITRLAKAPPFPFPPLKLSPSQPLSLVSAAGNPRPLSALNNENFNERGRLRGKRAHLFAITSQSSQNFFACCVSFGAGVSFFPRFPRKRLVKPALFVSPSARCLCPLFLLLSPRPPPLKLVSYS